MKRSIDSFLHLQWVVGGMYCCLFLCLALLLFRNPYGSETLIPNLEPYPDTFHYIVPALELAEARMPVIRREDYSFPANVPPLYSLILTPGFMVNSRPETYYFTNVLLMFFSLSLLLVLLKKITASHVATFFVSLFFILNFYINWLPTLAMAENLLLGVFLFQLLLLYEPISQRNMIIAGFITLAPFATKYAAAPITVVFALLFFCKYILEEKHYPFSFLRTLRLIKGFRPYLIALLTSCSLYLLFQELVGTATLIDQATYVLQEWFFSVPSTPAAEAQSVKHIGFSLQYFSEHFKPYFFGVFGLSQPYLWHALPFWPLWISVISLLGYVFSYRKLSRNKFFILALAVFLLSQVCFMATFYVVDLRYVVLFLPFIPLGIAFLYQAPSYKNAMLGLIIGLLLLFGYSQRGLLMRTILLNYTPAAERPWYSLFAKDIDTFFLDYKKDTARSEEYAPLLISPLPIFIHDFSGMSEYEILPLSLSQDFIYPHKPALLWGYEENYNTLSLIEERLSMGQDVYIAFVQKGITANYTSDLESIAEHFALQVVIETCEDQCILYEVGRKNTENVLR